MKMITKYRLLKVLDTSSNGTFTVTLADESNYSYGPDYRSDEQFDSLEEAIEFTKRNAKWHNADFTILPVHRLV